MKPFVITINDFKAGTQTLLDDSRIPQSGVKTSQNMMLDQDGIWRIRVNPDGGGYVSKWNYVYWLIRFRNWKLQRAFDYIDNFRKFPPTKVKKELK